MKLLYALLYLLALICFLVGTFGGFPKINLIALGLAVAITPTLIETFRTIE
jgi:hypothetical protein